MEELKLVRPAPEHILELQEFRQELFKAEDADSFAGCSRLEKYEDMEEWMEMVWRQEQEVEPGKVPSHVYLAIRQSDERLVGIIDLRHHIDHPILGLWGGHIGYTVRPNERGKGYAREMLRLNLENCRRRGLDKVMVTCTRNNPASERTILGCGGVFEKEVLVDGEWIKRYWITLMEEKDGGEEG
ncbi:MAG: GNAT family N-acetyltransferase [Acetatifactor sp.]|nr:GNAT family N-acetyltransferase [Acetatifactor sp.]MDE5952388.1 GNAT family N-acetyltransferase [Acetatifactor sp.]